MNGHILTENERAFVIDAIGDALMEIEELEEISEGVVDKLTSALEILGEY